MKSMRQKQDSWVSEQEAEPVECIKAIWTIPRDTALSQRLAKEVCFSHSHTLKAWCPSKGLTWADFLHPNFQTDFKVKQLCKPYSGAFLSHPERTDPAFDFILLIEVQLHLTMKEFGG